MRTWSLAFGITLAALCAALPVNPIPAFAAGTEGGIGLAPAHVDENNPDTRAYFIRSVDQAGGFSDQVIVANSTSSPVQLYVNAVDGLTSPASGAVYANRQDPARKAGLWVTPDVSTITVPAKSRALVGFTVHVPADAVPGDHLAGLAFENAQPTTTSGGGALAVTTVLRSVMGVLVQVPGPVAFHLRIDGVSIQPLSAFGTAGVRVTLADDGLLLGKPLLEIRVAGDHYDRTLSKQLDTLLPADVIELEVPWPDALTEGDYQVTVTGSGAGLNAPVTFVSRIRVGRQLRASRPEPPASTPGLSAWWLAPAAGIVLGLGIGIGALPSLLRRRRRPGPIDANVDAPRRR